MGLNCSNLISKYWKKLTIKSSSKQTMGLVTTPGV